MKKSDLKSGMVVTLRSGKVFLVVEIGEQMILLGYDLFVLLSDYTECMKHKREVELDIVCVHRDSVGSLRLILNPSLRNPIWVREEAKEISEDEAMRILREHYGCDVKIMQE